MITVLCPTYNEEKHINDLIHFFCMSEPQDKELFIIDGGSTDKTLDMVNHWQKDHKNIHLLHNPRKYVPFALNMGIKGSTGNLIIRLDAHTIYSPDYFMTIIKTLEETGADIVGGPMNTTGLNDFQRAVGYATLTPFGTGDSKLHDLTYKGYTDHVYLGAWRRDLFESIGYFDERFLLNEDDEFHYRAKSLGKTIYLNPEIKSFYLPRNNIKKLFIQYLRYGKFKPIVIFKIKSEAKLRHLVPAGFLIYLCTFPFWFAMPILFLPVLLYMLLNVLYSLSCPEKYKVKFLSFIVYPVLHLGYGLGTLIGIHKILSFKNINESCLINSLPKVSLNNSTDKTE